MTYEGEDMTLYSCKTKLSTRQRDTAKTAEKIHKDILTLTGKPLNPCPWTEAPSNPRQSSNGFPKHNIGLKGNSTSKMFMAKLTKVFPKHSRPTIRPTINFLAYSGITKSRASRYMLLMSAKWKKRERNNSEASLSPGPRVLIISVWREIWKIQLKELSKGFINRPLPPPLLRLYGDIVML